jgi:site-specific DNA recombinase
MAASRSGAHARHDRRETDVLLPLPGPTTSTSPTRSKPQDTRLTAYIDSQPGWRQAARFADDASGATTSRPGLQRALAAARAGVIDVLLVYRVDRFTRSLRDLVTMLGDLDQAGVVFRSATEPFDTATAMGRMLGMFAQFERDTIIDRAIACMAAKPPPANGKGGRRPFGYQVDTTAQTLASDAHEATVVRLIFESYTRTGWAPQHRHDPQRTRSPDHDRRPLVRAPGTARPRQPRLPR